MCLVVRWTVFNYNIWQMYNYVFEYYEIRPTVPIHINNTDVQAITFKILQFVDFKQVE